MKHPSQSFKLAMLRHSQSGFTLTEMLIVVIIIALIGTFVTTNLISRYNQTRVDATRIQMKNLSGILEQYHLDCGSYPSSDQGLESLVSKPADSKCGRYLPGGYIKNGEVPKDGFGNDFYYFSDGKSFEIRSLGADNKEGGDGIDGDVSSKETPSGGGSGGGSSGGGEQSAPPSSGDSGEG